MFASLFKAYRIRFIGTQYGHLCATDLMNGSANFMFIRHRHLGASGTLCRS